MRKLIVLSSSGAAARLGGTDQRIWLETLARDLDNIRGALRWLHESEPARLHAAAGLIWLLWLFLWARGYLADGRRWAEAIRARSQTDGLDQASAAWVASTAALDAGDYPAAPALVDECLSAFREAGDAYGLARGDERGVILALAGLGNTAMLLGDFAACP
jgi:hypothetical protein